MQRLEIGLQITEKEYRALPYPSYSLLSSISKHGAATLAAAKEDISELDSIIIGSIVDSIVTDGGPPDNMVIVDKKPSAKALAIIKALAQRTDLVDKYLISIKNEVQIKEECDKLEYYKTSSTKDRIKYLKKYNKYVKALTDFGDDAFIVSSYHFKQSTELANSLFKKFPFLLEDNVIPQVKILGKVAGTEIKGMLDFVVVDHENKEITPFDLKTGIGKHNEFFEKGFLNWGYYIQASLYKELLEEEIKGTPLDEYKVNDFKFMYCGRQDRLPIIYRVTPKWHEAGLQGFEVENVKFPGVYELLDDFNYYKTFPNSYYKRGYGGDEVEFDDSICNIKPYGK